MLVEFLARVRRLRSHMADRDEAQTTAAAGSLTPEQEAGPDLPDREGVPPWVPRGKEERWRNSVKVAEQQFPGNQEMVWQVSRMIFNDEANYPD